MRWCLNLNSLFVRGKLSYSLKLACARLRGIKTLDERKQKDWEAHQSALRRGNEVRSPCRTLSRAVGDTEDCY